MIAPALMNVEALQTLRGIAKIAREAPSDSFGDIGVFGNADLPVPAAASSTGREDKEVVFETAKQAALRAASAIKVKAKRVSALSAIKAVQDGASLKAVLGKFLPDLTELGDGILIASLVDDKDLAADEIDFAGFKDSLISKVTDQYGTDFVQEHFAEISSCDSIEAIEFLAKSWSISLQ
tara:strand:- start:366 stop:905 length:540 start_codon:yes stop_codon:yes gene_type:complete